VTMPHIVPLKAGTVVFVILQTPSFFVLVNNLSGFDIVGYDGRAICQFKSPSLAPNLLNTQTICATNDSLAVVDAVSPKCVHFYDPFTSRSLSDSIRHSTNIIEIALNVAITSNIRKIAFIDSNKDLFVTKVHSPSVFKLKTIVDSVAWHPDCDLLLALSDKQLVIWYYPGIVWCDTDLIPSCFTQLDAHEIGQDAKILSIESTLVRIRKKNGDEQIVNFSPLPLALHNVVADGKWDKALRLCTLCDDETLWGALTGLAIDNGQIEVAVQGLTALEEPDKILFLRSILDLPLRSQRDAELALFRKNTKSAENILLQNDLVFRAIQLNLRLFKWKRALEVAIDYRTHIDTVIAFRGKYLENTNKTETIDLFLKYRNEVDINWNVIEEKCRQELDDEFRSAGVKRSAASGDQWMAMHRESSKMRKSGRKELEALLGVQSEQDDLSDGHAQDRRPENVMRFE